MKVYIVADYARASTSEFSVVSASSEEEAIKKHNACHDDAIRTSEIIEYTENNQVSATLLTDDPTDEFWYKDSVLDSIIQEVEVAMMSDLCEKLDIIDALEALKIHPQPS